MKKIAVLSTGGTILMDGSPARVSFSIEQLISHFPEIQDIAEVESREVLAIDSSNINPQNWQELARTTYPYLERSDIDGIVITHGTDTMEFSTMALALMLQNLNKPVVFTGTMKTVAQDKEHVRRNLVDAINVAANSNINEVVLCAVADPASTYSAVQRGSRVFKYSTGDNDAFRSFHDEPLIKVEGGRVIYNCNTPVRTTNGKLQLDTTLETNVAWQEGTPFQPLLLDGLKGVILRTQVDNRDIASHIPYSRYPEILRALAAGTVVGVTADCYDVNLKNDPKLLEHGIIPLGDMRSSKAIVKMMCVLPKCDGDPTRAREMLQQDYVGEITPESYLIK